MRLAGPLAAALLSALAFTMGASAAPGIVEPQAAAAAAERYRYAPLHDVRDPGTLAPPTPDASDDQEGAPPVETALRPDIVVLMLDDLLYLPDQRVLRRLPNIERTFIDGGMRFSNMNSTVALCGPSRATLLTGRYPLHHGVVRNDDVFKTPGKTINNRLMQAGGYTTLNQGKGIHVDVWGGRDIGWSKRDKFARRSTRFKNQGVRWIENAPRDRPLFAWYSTNYPHEVPGTYYPYVEPELRGDPRCRGLALFKPPTYTTWDRPRPMPFHMPMDVPAGWDLTTTCESLLGIDDAIGAIVQAQQERERPVVLVLMTDHGVAHGQFGYPFKWSPYARRTEFYMAGTGIPAGVSTDALLSDIDVAPTLAQAAGVELGYGVDGESFWPLALGDESYPGRRYHLCHFEDPDPSLAFRCIVTPEWFAIFWGDGREKLTTAKGWGRWNLKDVEPRRLRTLRARADEMYRASRS